MQLKMSQTKTLKSVDQVVKRGDRCDGIQKHSTRLGNSDSADSFPRSPSNLLRAHAVLMDVLDNLDFRHCNQAFIYHLVQIRN